MQTIPIRGASHPVSFQGICEKKPWQYQTTAIIPVIDCSDMTEICIEILRLQKPKPYIILIDTGSTEEHFHRHLSLRAEDLEVHTIRSNGITHPSMLVSAALDLGFSAALTEWIFTTHQDCFLKRRNVITDLIKKAEEANTPVAGYRMTQRVNEDWRISVGHTCTVWHLPSCSKMGLAFSIRRYFDLYNLPYHPDKPSWPDTEACANLVLQQNNIKPLLVGNEKNFQRNTNEDFDHCRSAPGSNLYSKLYFEHWASRWWIDARQEAIDRINRWANDRD